MNVESEFSGIGADKSFIETLMEKAFSETEMQENLCREKMKWIEG